MRKQRGRKEKGDFMSYEEIYKRVEEHLQIELEKALDESNPHPEVNVKELEVDYFIVLTIAGVTLEWVSEQRHAFIEMSHSYYYKYLHANLARYAE
jgi:hypothetical protein